MANIKIAVVGLGYVGLPLALAFARRFPGTIGFDISAHRVGQIKNGIDPTREGLEAVLKATSLVVTATASDMKGANFFVVGVPTPVDENHNPDLSPLIRACEFVGSVLVSGSIVVFESTVYPGVTEDICGPLLEKHSGLVCGKDFFLGYSPERINPGDKEHTLERILKVVSGQDKRTLEIVSKVYGTIIEAGVFEATSVKVAEAAKVIENTQRDINIALMNELSLIFEKMGLRTKDVLDAAGTKWNFLKFSPGLVGGHCIGVDPYYLTTKAELLGYHPQVILAGRRINDTMGKFVAQKAIKLLIHRGIQPKGARVGVLGLTFKENVSDIRNSRVPDIIAELHEFGAETLAFDPYADFEETRDEYGISLSTLDQLRDLDLVIFAVPHKAFIEMGPKALAALLKPEGVFVDVKSTFSASELPASLCYWSL